MKKIDDGGPAFPGEQGSDRNGCWNQTWNPGMSIHDWFAGQALAGLMASQWPTSTKEMYASWSYEYADAMIAEKRRREGGGV